MLARLLAPYLLALAAIATGIYGYSDSALENVYVTRVADDSLRQARLVGALLPWDERGPALDARCVAVGQSIDARVTVIAADGTVLGDSEVASSSLKSHRDRPEVRAALEHGEGQDTRVSASVHHAFFYRALRQTRGDGAQREERVVRLAVPIEAIDEVRYRVRSAMWTGFGVAAVAISWPVWILARRLSRRLSRLTEFADAVTQGHSAPRLIPTGSDAVSRFEHDLVTMTGSLQAELRSAREQHSQLDAVLSNMVEGVVVIDRDGVIRLANRCAEQLFGLTAAGMAAGRPLMAVSRNPDLHAVVRAVTDAPIGGPPVVRETTVDHRTLEVTGTAIAEAAAAPRLFILVFHDITDLKKLEATRRDFVANVSHELRTPLTAIRGYAETLQAGALNDPAVAPKFVGVIERHSERLSRLIDDLLVLSDLELGRTELQQAPVLLASALDSATDLVREKAVRGQVTIARDLAPDLPLLNADADRIEQLLVNLIDNAVKYTPAGGCVTVAAGLAELPLRDNDPGGRPTAGFLPRDTSTGRWLAIRIADTGVGVPSQDLPRLTERFYRVDKARSRELGGTGLGLAIVKHIIQAHGGGMQITSELGHGTCVIVYLPAAG